MCITCVSLKSLTPTQYTIAPRDLALSACSCTEGINVSFSENSAPTAILSLELLLQWFGERASVLSYYTSCCAVMSWCSCNSPSVSAIITLAVPGENIKSCYSFNMMPFSLKCSQGWDVGCLPKFSWNICSFAFKWENIFMVTLSGNSSQHWNKSLCQLWFSFSWFTWGLPSAAQGAWTCLHLESPFSERSAPFWCPLCREETQHMGHWLKIHFICSLEESVTCLSD